MEDDAEAPLAAPRGRLPPAAAAGNDEDDDFAAAGLGHVRPAHVLSPAKKRLSNDNDNDNGGGGGGGAKKAAGGQKGSPPPPPPRPRALVKRKRTPAAGSGEAEAVEGRRGREGTGGIPMSDDEATEDLVEALPVAAAAAAVGPAARGKRVEVADDWMDESDGEAEAGAEEVGANSKETPPGPAEAPEPFATRAKKPRVIESSEEEEDGENAAAGGARGLKMIALSAGKRAAAGGTPGSARKAPIEIEDSIESED